MSGAAPGDPPFLRRLHGGVVLRLRLTPRAARDGVDGVVSLGGGGGTALAVRLRARPVEGEANAALAAFLAGALELPRSAVFLEKGAAARIKTVRLSGDPESLAAACARLAPTS